MNPPRQPKPSTNSTGHSIEKSNLATGLAFMPDNSSGNFDITQGNPVNCSLIPQANLQCGSRVLAGPAGVNTDNIDAQGISPRPSMRPRIPPSSRFSPMLPTEGHSIEKSNLAGTGLAFMPDNLSGNFEITQGNPANCSLIPQTNLQCGSRVLAGPAGGNTDNIDAQGIYPQPSMRPRIPPSSRFSPMLPTEGSASAVRTSPAGSSCPEFRAGGLTDPPYPVIGGISTKGKRIPVIIIDDDDDDEPVTIPDNSPPKVSRPGCLPGCLNLAKERYSSFPSSKDQYVGPSKLQSETSHPAVCLSLLEEKFPATASSKDQKVALDRSLSKTSHLCAEALCNATKQKAATTQAHTRTSAEVSCTATKRKAATSTSTPTWSPIRTSAEALYNTTNGKASTVSTPAPTSCNATKRKGACSTTTPTGTSAETLYTAKRKATTPITQTPTRSSADALSNVTKGKTCTVSTPAPTKTHTRTSSEALSSAPKRKTTTVSTTAIQSPVRTSTEALGTATKGKAAAIRTSTTQTLTRTSTEALPTATKGKAAIITPSRATTIQEASRRKLMSSASQQWQPALAAHIRASGNSEAPQLVPLGERCQLCQIDLAFTQKRTNSYTDDPPITAVLPCGHCFHYSCLEDIFGPPEPSQTPPCIQCLESGVQK